MKKSLVTIILCAVMTLSPLQGGCAENNLYLNDTIDKKVVELTGTILAVIEPEKELYGMGDADFNSLQLGKAVPAYIYTDHGIAIDTEIMYFPILYNRNWIATSIVSFDSSGKMNVQISNAYTEIFLKLCSSRERIALLFDASTAYLCTEKRLIKLADSLDTIEGRGLIEKSSVPSIPVIARVIPYYNIHLEALPLLTEEGTRNFPNQYYLSVPCIQQASGSSQCWAACIASIRGYYGINTTIDNVYDFSGIPKYDGNTIQYSGYILEDYGFTVTWYWDPYFYWYQYENEIYSNEAPFFAACSYNNQNNGHAIVLRGYYNYVNISQVGILCYMDPITGSYGASTVATDGDFYYIPMGSSTGYRLFGFLAVSE